METNGNLALMPRVQTQPAELDWDTPEKLILICEMYGGKSLSNTEFEIFLNHARAVRLNPLTRQIQCIKFDGKPVPYTTIHGLVAIACRSGSYGGVDEIEYDVEPTGREGEHPNWARARVYKIVQGHVRACTAKVYWTERNRGMASWKSQKWTMLGKCALSAAFRLGWEETAGIYIEEELGIENGKIVDAAPAKATPAPAPAAPITPLPEGKTWSGWCAEMAKELGIFDNKDQFQDWITEVAGRDPRKAKLTVEQWSKVAAMLDEMVAKQHQEGLEEEDAGMAKMAGLDEPEQGSEQAAR